MKKRKLICKKCGYKFEEEAVDPDEAREKRVRTSQIRCPKCGGEVAFL
ncbi:MAG: hypothetical protein ABIK53_03295 [bacterium]